MKSIGRSQKFLWSGILGGCLIIGLTFSQGRGYFVQEESVRQILDQNHFRDIVFTRKWYWFMPYQENCSAKYECFASRGKRVRLMVWVFDEQNCSIRTEEFLSAK